MESNNFIKSFIIFLSCHFLGTPKRKDKEKIRRKRKKERSKIKEKEHDFCLGEMNTSHP